MWYYLLCSRFLIQRTWHKTYNDMLNLKQTSYIYSISIYGIASRSIETRRQQSVGSELEKVRALTILRTQGHSVMLSPGFLPKFYWYCAAVDAHYNHVGPCGVWWRFGLMLSLYSSLSASLRRNILSLFVTVIEVEITLPLWQCIAIPSPTYKKMLKRQHYWKQTKLIDVKPWYCQCCWRCSSCHRGGGLPMNEYDFGRCKKLYDYIWIVSIVTFVTALSHDKARNDR